MQPIIVTFLNRREDIDNLREIIDNCIKDYNDIDVSPIFYICSNLSYTRENFGQLVYYPHIHVKMGEESCSAILKRHPNSYIIRQSSNIITNTDIYKWIHTEMLNGSNAILFHWSNPICTTNCWCLSFFVTKDEKYYPDRTNNSEHDCAEVAWGRYLAEHNLSNFKKSHNFNENKFRCLPIKPIFIPQFTEVIEEGVVIEDIELGFWSKLWNWCKRWVLWQR